MMKTVLEYIFYIISFIVSIYGAYAIYYGYFKKKDERQQYIVFKSATEAFLTIIVFFLIYYIIDISVNVVNVIQLNELWNLIHLQQATFSAGAAVSWMMLIFGICLFKNKYKNGGD